MARAKATKRKPATKSKKPEARALQLDLESGKVLKNVTARQLRSAIAREKFAILGTGSRGNTYIQTAVQEESPFLYILEYQEGSTAKHFRAVSDGVDIDDVVAAFTKYLAGDPTWRDDFTWERMKL